MTCESWDVVVVPFPFTDRVEAKRRPAVVLSTRPFNSHGHTVLAMITSSAQRPWPGDSVLQDVRRAGLRQECMVRLKIFTLDNRLIRGKAGELASADRERVIQSLKTHLPM